MADRETTTERGGEIDIDRKRDREKERDRERDEIDGKNKGYERLIG